MEKISYYDLLGMVRSGDMPERLRVEILKGDPKYYRAEFDGEEFSHYYKEDFLKEESYSIFLSECFLESGMFDNVIEVIDEDIEKWGEGALQEIRTKKYQISDLQKYIEILMETQNEIIDKVNSIEKMIR